LPFSVCVLTTFLCSWLFSSSQDIHFTVVKRSQDDVGFVIAGMTQDAQGFLWLATQVGLYKYDGHQYTSYHHEPSNPNSPADDNIWCVAADKAGYVWLGPARMGLDRFDPATGLFTHFRHKNNDPGSLGNDTVITMLQDHEGTLWIATLGGLDRFDSKSNKFLHYKNNANDPSSLSCNVVMAIYEDKQQTIWVGTGTPFQGYDNCGGLNKLNRETGKFTRYLHNENDPHSLIDNRVRAIYEDSRGVFWVGTAGDGLHTMDRTKGTFERHLYDPSRPEKLSRPPVKATFAWVADHITFIFEDHKSRIWIGTMGGGINVYDPSTQKVSYYGSDKNSKEKIANNDFAAAYMTKDNVIWLSSGNFYKVLPDEHVLPHIRMGNEIRSFAEDDAHTLWMSSVNGLIHITTDGKEEHFLINKDSSYPDHYVHYIEKDVDKFWLASPQGLYLFDLVSKTFTGYFHQPGNVNGLLANDIRAIKKTTDNKLWIGCINGLDLMDTKSGTFTHFQNKLNDTSSISGNSVFAISIDEKQRVWVGTDMGLNRLDTLTGRFKRYLNQTPINCVTEDHEGALWCGTNAGFFKYEKEKDNFRVFNDESAIISSSLTVYWIVEDHEQNLWLNTRKGIIRLNKERTSAVLYGKNQGVSGPFLSRFGYTRQNGEVLYGDSSGYFVIKPSLLQQNVFPPLVTVNNFLLNNTPVQPSKKGVLSVPLIQTKEIRLRYNQNTFSFEFSNIDFISDPDDTRLLYTLQNYDNAWHKAGDEKASYYFNVPPGKYVFKLKAFNAAGIAAEKDISIIITPPWWKTWWAYTLYVLAFVGAVATFIAYRSRKLRRENKILEEKVSRRTTQLQQKSAELEKSLNTLKSTQAQLIQSEKMASLGELTAGIAHEIQNPLNFVNNFSEVSDELVDEMKSELATGNTQEAIEIADDVKQNLGKILHHGKRADAIVRGMLQHSRASSGQKEPTDINALADEYLRLAYHGLRAKDKSFNARFETDLDKGIGKINVVPEDIGRVLLNLINNAFYAVNEKKQQLDGAYEPAISVITRRIGPAPASEEAKIEIKIKDNGNGIPQKVLGKIFQPFFTTKPTGVGTGLGLSLSYDIIKAHGGNISIDTREGEGSTFTIQLMQN
jgi:signal transduction histidine kinase/ligand-binding sensor domain-containing protein